MAKANVLEYLYSKQRSALEFNFDNLIAPPLLSLLTPQDIFELNRIARSVKLSGKIDEKYRLIDNIMNNRGFIKLHAGTNRVVYKFLEDQSFVIKVAVDRVGLGDNPAEFRNQFLLKPFVTKVFDVSPCGTVALVERVDAIMSREEFASVADDVFNLLTKVFIGKYVLEDVGTWFFMNWGIRNGFGPVLLDFPYVYELDGNKLYCNAHPPGRKDIRCNGELDYDDGFNNLVCTKCGRHYHARDLKKAEKDQLIIVGGKKTMRVKVMIGNEVILDSGKNKVAKVIDAEPVTSNTEVIVNEKNEKSEPITEVEPKKEITRPEGLKTISKPKAAIFNKSNTIKTENVIGERRVVAAPLINNDNEEDGDVDMKKDKNFIIENEEMINDKYGDEDEYDDYEDDDEEDYEQYLSNRERKQIRRTEKQNRRTDYGDF